MEEFDESVAGTGVYDERDADGNDAIEENEFGAIRDLYTRNIEKATERIRMTTACFTPGPSSAGGGRTDAAPPARYRGAVDGVDPRILSPPIRRRALRPR